MKKILPTYQFNNRSNSKPNVSLKYLFAEEKECAISKNNTKSLHTCSLLDCQASDSSNSNSDMDERSRTKPTRFLKAYPKTNSNENSIFNSETHLANLLDPNQENFEYSKTSSTVKENCKVKSSNSRSRTERKEKDEPFYDVATLSSDSDTECAKYGIFSDEDSRYNSIQNKSSDAKSKSFKYMSYSHSDDFMKDPEELEKTAIFQQKSRKSRRDAYINYTYPSITEESSSETNDYSDELLLESSLQESASSRKTIVEEANYEWAKIDLEARADYSNEVLLNSSLQESESSIKEIAAETNYEWAKINLEASNEISNYAKSTRPFKSFPLDPLEIAIGFDTAKMSIADGKPEDYSEFRKRMVGNNSLNKSDIHFNMRRSYTSEVMDASYREKRKKNNMAAKRSRDARREKEDEIAVRCAYLEQENMYLKRKVAELEKERDGLNFQWK